MEAVRVDVVNIEVGLYDWLSCVVRMPCAMAVTVSLGVSGARLRTETEREYVTHLETHVS